MLAVLLVGEHRTVDAKATAEVCAADDRLKRDLSATETTAYVFVRLGEPSRAVCPAAEGAARQV